MVDGSIALADVVGSFARLGSSRAFEPKVEAVFRDEVRRFRRLETRRATVPTLVIYNLLLLSDFLLLPETAAMATLLHLVVISPLVFGLFILHGRFEGYLASQVLATCIPLLIVLQTVYIFSSNDGYNAGHYQYFISLIILFSIVNQRLDFKVALVGAALMIIPYAATAMVHTLPIHSKISGLVFALVASYLALAVNMNFQRDARHAFLMRLREEVRFRTAEADAVHDPLTGLHNRRYVQDFARQLSERSGSPATVSVILLDVDFFKRYNDLHGHGQGDNCLRSVARAIEAALAPGEGTAIRYGGEEFLVLLPGAPGPEAARCAERVRASVEAEAILHGRSDTSDVVTVSLGVAVGQPTAETFGALIASADKALYVAKAEGRNRVCTEWEIAEQV